MQSIGKAYLCFDRVDTVEEMTADVMAVTPEELRQTAAEAFAPNGISTLIYGN